ncbi:MAG: cupin domain-containing protein [Thermoleophilaceae bacterium]|nr:cupin domain-containing protein [Thermoleophilaceae bacterium]
MGEVLGSSDEREVRVLLERPELSVTWSRFAAGRRGAEPHVHHRHIDCFYVLGGELTVTVGPELERVTLGEDGFFAAPPDLIHGFDNDGAGEVRYLNLHTPDSGFIDYMRAVRDGTGATAWDSFDPPADGGRPRSEAVVSPPGSDLKLDRPEIAVTDGPPAGADFAHELGGGRVFSVILPG